MTEKKELNDFTGPFDPAIDLNEFSKDFLVKMMHIWGELYEAYEATLVRLVPTMGVEGFGPKEMMELQIKVLTEVGPPAKEKIAELCKIDLNTMVGMFKAGRFIPDNLTDHYTKPKIEIISDKEATLTFDRCSLIEGGLLGDDMDVLHHVCYNVEPKICEAYNAYPNRPNLRVKMLKVPESKVPPPPGEPICKWHFTLEDKVTS